MRVKSGAHRLLLVLFLAAPCQRHEQDPVAQNTTNPLTGLVPVESSRASPPISAISMAVAFAASWLSSTTRIRRSSRCSSARLSMAASTGFVAACHVAIAIDGRLENHDSLHTRRLCDGGIHRRRVQGLARSLDAHSEPMCKLV